MSRKKKNNLKLPHYQVTAGLIQNNEKILITQRPLNNTFGGFWEFPGGKQKAGETLKQCLSREIFEELGIQIQVDQKFMSVSHNYDHLSITLHVFWCTFLEGTPKPKGVQDWKWIALSEFEQYVFTEADQKVIQTIKALKHYQV